MTTVGPNNVPKLIICGDLSLPKRLICFGDVVLRRNNNVTYGRYQISVHSIVSIAVDPA
jgi:hypothetical protein